ncbi:LYR motif-containing protein 4 isoform X1 [Pangasianodon hypophthalmus]|uniref:LYR motif-containing protein 4 isoform X1 n=1 Tax=Pangasianodon hypophthalmus TaxID=310915 RepID=UPI00230818C7|nr:LYR motif-containing protein 4 isoform X1 [Pangasianodon hypophthalmus]
MVCLHIHKRPSEQLLRGYPLEVHRSSTGPETCRHDVPGVFQPHGHGHTVFCLHRAYWSVGSVFLSRGSHRKDVRDSTDRSGIQAEEIHLIGHEWTTKLSVEVDQGFSENH